MGKNFLVARAAFLLMPILMMVGCDSDDNNGVDEPEKRENKVVFDYNTDLAYDELYGTRAYMAIESDERWEITVTNTKPAYERPWLTCSVAEGEGDKLLTISNGNVPNTGYDRTAVVTISFESNSRTITINQAGSATPPSGDIPSWTELPATDNIGDKLFIAHFCDLDDGRTVRNYSMLYDPHTFTSPWVAYPLHDSYLSDVKRTEKWAYDARVPQRYQLDYSSAGFGNNTWDRGHQIASADRTATVLMNNQTFYYTNITPQRYRLNQVKWANLETYLRGKVSREVNSTDTLWVVTGAVFQDLSTPGDEQIAYLTNDKNPGIQIPVPNYYYKVALRRKSDGNYTSVGFWMKNEDTSGAITSADALSVRDIEQKTGFNFFANLPADTQESFEPEFESDDWF